MKQFTKKQKAKILLLAAKNIYKYDYSCNAINGEANYTATDLVNQYTAFFNESTSSSSWLINERLTKQERKKVQNDFQLGSDKENKKLNELRIWMLLMYREALLQGVTL
jgi:hypothetical protein